MNYKHAENLLTPSSGQRRITELSVKMMVYVKGITTGK